MAEAVPLAPQQPEILKQPDTLTPQDYSVTVEPARKRVKVVFNGKVIASTRRALVLKETRLPPVYYLPREDIAMALKPGEYEVFVAMKEQSPEEPQRNQPPTPWEGS